MRPAGDSKLPIRHDHSGAMRQVSPDPSHLSFDRNLTAAGNLQKTLRNPSQGRPGRDPAVLGATLCVISTLEGGEREEKTNPGDHGKTSGNPSQGKLMQNNEKPEENTGQPNEKS